MKRRVKDTPVSSNVFCGDFYNTYRKPIDWFFGERKEENIYIRDYDTVKKIEENISNDYNNVLCLIGKAGIGKTTLLKNEYNLTNNTVSFDVKRRAIFVSVNFRGKIFKRGNLNNFLVNSIVCLCDSIEEVFNIGNSFYAVDKQLEFYEFVKKTMISLLGYANKTELNGKNDVEKKLLKLNRAEEIDRYSYEVSRLKYYLLKYMSSYNKIVFFIDDIETLDEDLWEKVVKGILSMLSLMLDVPSEEKERMFSIAFVLSMRDTTFYKLMKKEKIAAYEPIVIIHQDKPVDIFAFLEKKYEEMRCDNSDECKIRDEMYEIVQNFIRKFGGKYSIMIKNLSNYDFATEKRIYKKIFTNKLWLLRNDRRKNFLDMSRTDALFNNISVIRTIGCGNNAVYRGAKSNIIPNIFLNEEIHDDCMVGLLLLSYFIKNETRVQKRQLFIVFGEVFRSEEIQNALRRVIRHFLKSGILEEVMDFEIKNAEKEYMLNPRGKELFGMLNQDSVLLEMYKEDHFIEDRYMSVNFISSYNLMRDIGQYAIFIQMLIYIEILLEMEEELHKLAASNNKLEEYHNCFGTKLQTKRILEGVIRSIEYSGNMNTHGIDEFIRKLSEKMNKVD